MAEQWRARLAEAVDYALANGLVKLSASGEIAHAPLALEPFPISAPVEARLSALTSSFNRLAWRVSRDLPFLRDALTRAARGDSFLAGLLRLAGTSEKQQGAQLSILRSDYFLIEAREPGAPRLAQVELNTIAASYPGLSGRVQALHRYLYSGRPEADRLVPNDPLNAIGAGFARAYAAFGKPGAWVAMVVQPGERNRFDQRLLEFQLRDRGMEVLRVELEAIARNGVLRDGHLILAGRPVASAYFRAGYGPEDYRSEDAWRGRELIESSDAIPVPTVAMQLAGSKKVQQVLSRKERLAAYASPTEAAALHETFAGLFDPEEVIPQGEGALPAWRVALRNPERFVLKPQREGGGNNWFDEDLVRVLAGSTKESRGAYILMERLRPLPRSTPLVRDGELREGPAVSEIGRYGVLYAEGGAEKLNVDAGYLVRTKDAESREGGVSAGFGFLGSLIRESG
jgi:glutathione synthase